MTRLRCGWALLAAAAMLAFAASARAVDGTIEINQGKVTANGHSFPYVISNQGSYRLTSDLTPPASTDAIDVSAPNVTIDLNGFSIIGPGGTGSGLTPLGISATQNDVTVENGTVTGFAFGIDLGNFAVVRNVHTDKNGSGILTGFDSVVEDSTANNSTSTLEPGIGCGNESAISGNTANGNADYGIYCGSGCVISGNTADANVTGIDCAGTECLISANTVYNNSGTGILSNDSTTGWGGNVLDNNGTTHSGATSLGNNLCGGGPC